MRIVPLSPDQSPTRVVSVASGKGGVGKTSTAVGLAFALARRGNRVCILDADLGLANVDILLGASPAKTLEDVLFEDAPMAEAILNVGPGVDLVAGSSGVPRLAELTRTARRRLTEQFAELDDYDYLIVDNSPGISGQIVSLCLSSRDLIVVATPDATAITDAYALIKVLSRSGLWWSPFICVNRARSTQQARLIFEKIRATAGKHLGLDCRYLGCLLEDEAVSMAAALQKPVLEAAPRSQAARDLETLALALDEADSQGRRRDVSPQRFLDGSIMRIKQERNALAGIARTAQRFHQELARDAEPPAPPAPQDPQALLRGLTRLGRGLDKLELSQDPQDRNRLLCAMRAELTAMRCALSCPPEPPREPRRPAPVPASAPPRPRLHARPETLPPTGRETLPGMQAALAALAEVADTAPAKTPAQPAKALLVCPPSPMRDVLCEVISEAGLTPEPVHPRALNGGDHFAGYRLGLVCWDAPAPDLERIVARAGKTPVLMLRGFRRKPEHEPKLDGLPVTVLYKPFQVKTLFGAIRRAARA